MNPTDALFWTMDRIPELRSTIGALVLLQRPVSRERMLAEYARVAARLPRMRQRVVDVPLGLAPPEWVDDPQFDLEYHLRHIAVPHPGGLPELLAEIGPLYATSLDRDRPLWEAYVAEGLADGRGAMFVKMHHCLTDGVGGVRLFAELLGSRVRAEAGAAAPELRPRSTATAAMLWRALGYNLTETVATGAAVFEVVTDSLLHPWSTLSSAGRWLQTVTGFGQELTKTRASSPLHYERSLSRQISTFDMSLREIEAVCAALEATNNDIILTIVSGAMHRWHTSRGADVKELRALVPVNLRRDDDPAAGNRLALLAIGLPVGEPNPLRRLRAIQDLMGRVKRDRRASLYPLLARVLVAMPMAVAEQVGHQQTMRTNFVCTNVPGPRQACYFGGQLIEAIYPYAPLVGDHPVAVGLMSYQDRVWVGLDVDPLAMGDLQHFRDALAESYAEVLSVGRETQRPAPRRRPRARAAAAAQV